MKGRDSVLRPLDSGSFSPVLEIRRAQPRPGWEDVLAFLERGTALVIGAAGAGKTPLAGFLTAQLGRGLRRVAQIDADPGQTSIGPAGCLGLALTDPWQAPAAQWFIGDTVAGRRPLATVVGTARLAERARASGAEVVIVDAPAPTCGWELLHHLALAAGVDQVVAVESGDELRPFLDVVRPRVEIYRVPGPPEPTDEQESTPLDTDPRARRRFEAADSRLRAHLAEARPVRFARRRILDAAWTPGAVPAPGGIVGLLDPDGFCLALGVIEEVDDDSVIVSTPWTERARVARLQLGALDAVRHREEWRLRS